MDEITITLTRDDYVDVLNALADANDALLFELDSSAWIDKEDKIPMREQLERNQRLYNVIGRQNEPLLRNRNQLELPLEG